ncbi:MAG TPA: alkaline phosphatase family protein, partial [Myxococcota bacterium]|nr:alkaline phosphatase family protein [Myxococcota bacterium]
ALLAAAIAAVPIAVLAAAQPDRPGVFVVGVDGMDPVILERMIAGGEMPNFARLRDEGTFQTLGTSTPPQSPVAWSSFVTGMNPGGHGIFDFIHRDPATYKPISSATPAVADSGHALHAFGYVIPTSSPVARNNRGGTPWWDVLEDHGVHVEVYRIPGNFPTPPSKARVLGGMGTVDVRGGYGTYTLYTDQPVPEKTKGDIQRVRVQDLDLDGAPDTVNAILRGPPDQFHLEPGALPGDNDYLAKGVTIHLAADRTAAVVEIGEQRAMLRQGEWSDWIPVDYDALPMGLASVAGAVRFFAKELSPGFQVYASPVNISPQSPAVPLTSPDAFLDELFENLGFFYTKGMPEETEALKDGVFSDDDYLAQVALVQQDTRRMVDLALSRFEPGNATFVYLSDIDLQCHMLWRHADPKWPDAPPHPARDPVIAPRHAHDIERFYRDVDRELGEIRKRLPADAMLVVMSDHGFQPYTRKIHLNAWLRDNGYLALKDGKRTGQIASGDVDWSRTRAYGLGFNGLYLNLAGREGQGIVKPADAPDLAQELREKLTALRDPASGRRAVVRVDRAEDVYSPERRGEGPDLIVGYDRGYGASDESTLGEITEAVIEDNTSRWSGNHLMAPEVVPGILLTNRKLTGSGFDLTDLTVTLLDYYGIGPAPGMIGHPIH